MERRDRGDEWIKCNTYLVPGTSHTVSHLSEGGRYEFRVLAVNDAGPGAPSRPSESVTCGVMICEWTHATTRSGMPRREVLLCRS